MNPQKLITTLSTAFQAGDQLLIVGPPGIGKTDCVRQAAIAAGMDLIITHPAVSDPTDYKGFPARAAEGDHATFLPFGELWRAIQSTKPTVFFCDDLGQASESVQKALMHLLHGRRVNGHVLPDHVVFCGATNDVKQASGVTGLIEPVKSRWHSIIRMDSSLDDWCLWALKNNIDGNVIAFLRTRAELLHQFTPTKELKNSPCPRTWAAVSRFLNRGADDFELLAGAVGEGAATEFKAFLDLATKAPSIDAILLSPDTEPVPDEPSLKYVVASGLARRCNVKNIGAVMRYLFRMEQPFRVLTLKDALQIDRAISRTREFTAWAMEEGKELL